MPELPQRQRLYHKPPEWVCDDAAYFITVCCAKRGVDQLNQTALFEVMVQAVEHYEATGKWRVALFLAMPDHWHAMVQFYQRAHGENIAGLEAIRGQAHRHYLAGWILRAPFAFSAKRGREMALYQAESSEKGIR